MRSINQIHILFLSLIIVLFPLNSPFAAWGDNMYGNSSGHMMGSGYMGWFMIAFWFFLLIMLIFLIWWISRLPKTGGRMEKTALDILKERLATGEIEIDEFEKKKKLL